MRCNEDTVLVGPSIVLVPYRKEHVPRYHGWMQDPEIREQTASEPLSLDEEYEMQQSWHLDEDKLTFIILARDEAAKGSVPASAKEAIDTADMAGDVNLFLYEADDEDDAEGTAEPSKTDDGEAKDHKRYDGELEVMIAEPKHRRKGLGLEALSLLAWYVTSSTSPSCTSRPFPLSTSSLMAKVGLSNAPSLSLFSKLGFERRKVSEVWQEAELRLKQGASIGLNPLAILKWERGNGGTQ